MGIRILRKYREHASHLDVATDTDVRKQIKKLSEDFTSKVFQKIEEFNIIPGSTMFLGGVWQDFDAALGDEISLISQEMKCKDVHIICVNKNSIQLFWNYLKK
jgi:hypothetical protein